GHRSADGTLIECRVAPEGLVRALAVAEPELLVTFGAPGQCSVSAVDLEGEGVAAPGADLRDHRGATCPALEAQQQMSQVLGADRDRFRGAGGLRQALRRGGRPPAGGD